MVPVCAQLTKRFSSRLTSLVANKPHPFQLHDMFSTVSSSMHHKSGQTPICCYSLMTLLSLTYVRTPQYSLQHPIFAYVPRGRTSRLLFFSEITVCIHRIFSSAQQFGPTSGVVTQSKYLFSTSRPGKSCPSALKLGPRYAASFMERMELPPRNFPSRINVASSNASIASSTVLRCYFGLGELEITDEERFCSPTTTKWGEFEATAFDGLESSDKMLQFDLNRSADVLHPHFFTTPWCSPGRQNRITFSWPDPSSSGRFSLRARSP